MLDSAKVYQPDINEETYSHFTTCDLSKVDLYKQVREQFPEAQVIAYVPPRSAWLVFTNAYRPGFLECVLRGFHGVAQHYDAFYDFSIPSDVTTNPQNTYDGSHFLPEVSDEIATFLQGQPLKFGIDVSELSFEEYYNQYEAAVVRFLETEEPEVLIQVP
jgi:hypothetical protein